MLIDLLAPLPGQPPITGSVDRLFTGNYKSNGNLVSLKVDVIDFTDFQRYGCLASPGPGATQPHNHNITGTLYCHPDSNTVRLNITVLPCSDLKTWTPGTQAAATATTQEHQVHKQQEPVRWGQLPQSTNGQFGLAQSGEKPPAPGKQVQYSQYSEPVSPPSEPYDVPPLLDFHSEQLMSEIQNMAFDLKEGVSLHNITLSSQFPPENSAPSAVLPSPSHAGTALPGHGMASNEDKSNGQVISGSANPPPLSQPNVLVKLSEVSLVNTSFTTSTAKSATAIVPAPVSTMPPLLQIPTINNNPLSMSMDNGTSINNNITTKLIQPKIERSESLCSDHNPIMGDFLSYTDEMLDELDSDPNSMSTSPMSSTPYSISSTSSPMASCPSISSPLIFSPIKTSEFLYSPEKPLPKLIKSESFDMFTSLASSSTTQIITHTAPTPALVSTSPNPDPHPVSLLNSPSSRNRRNSSYDETKPHVCPQCGARFTTKSNLGQHAKIHLAVKPFICEICSHGFTRAAHYESHVAKHKGLKTHRCDQCGESFARLDNLLRHSARHKHGKIFDCNTCGKGFHRKDKLLEHEKVHSNDYKFPCTMCAKTFHTNDALKHHLPLHEDSSKTQCKVCLKFITIKSLSKHMSAFHRDVVSENNENNNNNQSSSNASRSKSRSRSNQHNDKNHGCQYCKKSFVSPAKLRLHVAKCHAKERLISAMADPPPLIISEEPHRDLGRGILEVRFPSPGSDSLPQQVPEMDNMHINSSPEEISEFGCSKDMSLTSGSYSIPTIHIPEFELQSKLADNHDITTEAIQALLFS